MHEDDRQEALDALGDALLWQLPPSRWAEIDRTVHAMSRALTDGDDEAFHERAADLELLGPLRGVSAENPPPDQSPERAQGQVRERINELVRSLVRRRPDQEQASGGSPKG